MSVRIEREDVVAMIEKAAARLTGGDLEEVVAMAMRALVQKVGIDSVVAKRRVGSLFGRFPGSVTVKDGYDLTAPTFDLLVEEEIERRKGLTEK